jgi:hypothetical protein
MPGLLARGHADARGRIIAQVLSALRIVVAALLLQSTTAEFSSALRKVIRQSRYRFADTKGVRVELEPGPRVWFEARTFLPGAEYCQVDRSSESYRCEWTLSPPRAKTKYAEVAAMTEQALGADWTKRARVNEVEFRSPASADPRVRVALKGGQVSLTVSLAPR